MAPERKGAGISVSAEKGRELATVASETNFLHSTIPKLELRRGRVRLRYRQSVLLE